MATSTKSILPYDLQELLKDGNKNQNIQKFEKQTYEQVFDFMNGNNNSDFSNKLSNYFSTDVEMLSLNSMQNAQGAGSKIFANLFSSKKDGVNEKIEPSCQGQVGDCWLLATLNSLSYSEKGRKIIKDAIKTDKNGNYEVNFKGVNAKITVSPAELDKAKASDKYSSGDDDMLLMEIAFEKAMDKIKNGKIKAPDSIKNSINDGGQRSIDGGYSNDVIYMLTGKGTDYQYNRDHWSHDDDSWCSSVKFQRALPWLADALGNGLEAVYDKLEKNIGGYCATIAFRGNEKDNKPVTIKDVDGKEVILSTGNGGHMWSIKSVEGDNVTIVNPWDSSNEITVSKKEIAKYVSGIETYKYN